MSPRIPSILAFLARALSLTMAMYAVAMMGGMYLRACRPRATQMHRLPFVLTPIASPSPRPSSWPPCSGSVTFRDGVPFPCGATRVLPSTPFGLLP